MMAPDHGTMAERLYEAYGEDAHWVDERGQEMSPWERLAPETKDHWTAVARKSAQMLL
jgi:hypothetical protein